MFSSTKYKSHRCTPDTVASEVFKPLCQRAKLDLLKTFFSLNFYSKKNPSWQSVCTVKGRISARGNKYRNFFFIMQNFCTKVAGSK